MADNDAVMQELLALSHQLGDPAHEWAILGEGNTSARVDEETFYVKASGSQLGTLHREQVSHVAFAPILEALRHAGLRGQRGQRPAVLVLQRRRGGA